MARIFSRRWFLMILCQIIVFQFLYIFILRKDLGNDTILGLGKYRQETNPWNRCSIDSKGRLDCECDLKGKGCPQNIVPNVVHYVLYNISEISFRHLVSIRSVLRNQKPDKIVLHCTCNRLTGHLWDRWLKPDTRIEVRTLPRLDYVFSQKIVGNKWEPWLAADALRLYVLMTSPDGGGIFLDNDVYVVSSLAKYFKYEMTLFSMGSDVAGQFIIAHRDARFLRFWLDSYDNQNFLKKWYFFSMNMGRVLGANSALKDLVHWTQKRKTDRSVCDMIYRHKSTLWRQLEVIHMSLGQHTLAWCLHVKMSKAPHFDENNVRTLNTSFGEMAREVLYEDF